MLALPPAPSVSLGRFLPFSILVSPFILPEWLVALIHGAAAVERAPMEDSSAVFALLGSGDSEFPSESVLPLALHLVLPHLKPGEVPLSLTLLGRV